MKRSAVTQRLGTVKTSNAPWLYLRRLRTVISVASGGGKNLHSQCVAMERCKGDFVPCQRKESINYLRDVVDTALIATGSAEFY